MITTLRSPMQNCRLLFIPVTVLTLILSPYARVPLHAAAGDLDPTFGIGGIVTTDFGSSTDDAQEVVIQPDGKIVAGGTRGLDFAVARYNTDGSLDATFGTGGLVVTDLYGGSYDIAGAVALQPDGKIVLAGQTRTPASPVTDQDFALVRYNSDGSLDSTFGTGGIVRTDFGSPNDEGAVSVAIDSVGRIVAVGSTYTLFSSGGRDFAVARYNPDGTLDTTFDGDGRVISINTPNFDGAVDVSIQADDRIVVLGFVTLAAVSNFAVVRYNTDGSLDTTFGGTGIVTTSFGGTSNQPSAVVVQPDGKVLAVGTVFPPANRDFALVRYNANGTLDSSFGVGGHVTTNFNPADRSSEVALQADGKIVVTGSSGTFSGSFFTVARYQANGTVDTSFGAGGIVTTYFNGFVDFARSVAIQADGKIVAAGQIALAPGNTVTDFAVVRYEP